MKKFFASYQGNIFIVIALAISFPLLFENALEHSFPLGYAGLFTQMSQQIADANFRLPMESPFYGPGGIPFAYPPFGLYLLAILIKLTGKYFIFLRLLPPLLSLLALIPLFYLTLELSDSSVAAAIAVILAGTSQDLYIAHAWAAGIVRAPAFLFALTSLYFFTRQLRSRSWADIILTGVFLGLAFMSHLLYGLFCVLWIGWWTLFNKNHNFWARLQDSMVSTLIAMLTASVWLITILWRYGIKILFNAFDSHGGTGSLSFWQNIQGLPSSFMTNIDPITSNILLSILVAVSVVILLLKREYGIVLFYLFIILAFPEGERFIFLLGCIVAGIGLSYLIDWGFVISDGRLKPAVFALILIPILGIIWWNGFKTLSRYAPLLSNETFDFAEHIQDSTLPDEKYLALVRQDEAEWLPFLFQRQPLVSQWGSEWLGAYNEQTHLMSRFGGCRVSEDWSCVESAILETGDDPDYVVTYVNDEKLNQQLLATGQWTQVYVNKRYTLWSRVN
ncbi:MAG: glycosyltransferase family 39 protein [Anaerolineae bacterium]|nr:glycosyltransferase family 39 protein [Anaerolineae bacterium]MCI0608391.1 glycosyltransferase family 39 protein [Anaerolineae bacterium]